MELLQEDCGNENILQLRILETKGHLIYMHPRIGSFQRYIPIWSLTFKFQANVNICRIIQSCYICLEICLASNSGMGMSAFIKDPTKLQPDQTNPSINQSKQRTSLLKGEKERKWE